jgi:hypothetical protein
MMKATKFLIAVDPDQQQLYILHREYPSCLIWVKQEIPARFIILDWYEEEKITEEKILEMPFVQEAKDFYKNYAEKNLGGN